MTTIQSRREARTKARNQSVSLGSRLQNKLGAIGLVLVVAATGLAGTQAVSAFRETADPMGRAPKGYVITESKDTPYGLFLEEGWSEKDAGWYSTRAEAKTSQDGIFEVPQIPDSPTNRLGLTDREVYGTMQEALEAQVAYSSQ